MKPTVIGIDSRCPHNQIVAIDETGCEICALYDVLMTEKYPFKLRYTGASNILDKGALYTAVGFIMSGTMERKGPIPGVLLGAVGGNGATLRTYSPTDFEFVEEEAQ